MKNISNLNCQYVHSYLARPGKTSVAHKVQSDSLMLEISTRTMSECLNGDPGAVSSAAPAVAAMVAAESALPSAGEADASEEDIVVTTIGFTLVART
jgi:hypothetical protein